MQRMVSRKSFKTPRNRLTGQKMNKKGKYTEKTAGKRGGVGTGRWSRFAAAPSRSSVVPAAPPGPAAPGAERSPRRPDPLPPARKATESAGRRRGRLVPGVSAEGGRDAARSRLGRFLSLLSGGGGE